MIYDNILETIGKTPVVRINRIAPDNVQMYVKVEAFNRTPFIRVAHDASLASASMK